jgi:hypothetical protein
MFEFFWESHQADPPCEEQPATDPADDHGGTAGHAGHHEATDVHFGGYFACCDCQCRAYSGSGDCCANCGHNFQRHC